MRKLVLLAAIVTLGAAVAPGSASAATCSDYSNQADAQRAGDTRDADGDGIYCESLPCPCLGAGGGGGGGSGPASPPPPSPSPSQAPAPSSPPPPAPPAAPPARPKQQVIAARILKVIDGDTLDVRAYGAARSRYRVRLIGIDTPERYGGRECGAREATTYMQRIAWRGRRVTLHTDPTQDLFDRYDRLLAYVDTPTGSLQSKMLTTGWAKVYVYGGVRFQRATGFERTARRAKRRHRGVWRMCRGNFHRRVR